MNMSRLHHLSAVALISFMLGLPTAMAAPNTTASQPSCEQLAKQADLKNQAEVEEYIGICNVERREQAKKAQEKK